MSFTHVQGNINTSLGNAGSESLAFGSAVTSGNVVTGVVGWSNASAGQTATVTDDKSNPYTVVTIQHDAGGNWYWAGFYSNAAITNAPSTITVTLSSSGQFIGMVIDEWNGLGAGSTTASSVAGNVSGGTSVSATLSPTTGDLCVAYVNGNGGSNTLTPGQTATENSGNFLGEWTTAASGSQAMTATTSNSHGTITAFSLTPASSGVNGSLSDTIAALTSSAAGVVLLQGALSETFSDITLSGAGIATPGGALTETISAITPSAAGTVVINGSLAQTMADITLRGGFAGAGGIRGIKTRVGFSLGVTISG